MNEPSSPSAPIPEGPAPEGSATERPIPARTAPAPPAPGTAPPPEPSAWSLIVTLGLAGLFSGIALVGVYVLTLPAIQRNRREALERAILTVLPGSTTFKTLADRGGKLALLADAEARKSKAPCVYAGYDARGQLVGFAVPGSEPGYQDAIHGILGFKPREKLIVGFQVLESRETPGLGDRIVKDTRWLAANFTALAVDPPIEAVSPGKKTAANQVETITGATISSSTVVRLLRKTLGAWRAKIEAWQAEHPSGREQP